MRETNDYQLKVAWSLLDLHLTGLGDDECMWRPADRGLHVVQVDGVWRAQWPESEAYDIGPPSIAWLTWHIGFWWSMALDHTFGEGELRREDIPWPGSAEATRAWLKELHDEWVAQLADLSNEDLASSERTRWPFRDRSLQILVAWLHVELMKNAAEIGYARFLYAVREGG